MNKLKNDRVLRFYKEVLGLEHLHYGLWEADPHLSIDNMNIAQRRYEDLIASHIPSDVKTTLEVGCGTGSLWQRMLSMGLDAEAMSPDVNQMEVLTKKIKAPFHYCRFEDFTPEKMYDLVLMSESSQYIPLDQLCGKVANSLRPKGYWLLCDYFTLDSAQGILAKSGHNYNKFMQKVRENGFSIVHEQDITMETSYTIDLAKDIVDRGEIFFDLLTQKFRHKHPIWTRLVRFFLKKQLKKINEDKVLLDSKKYRESKKYVLLLLQKNS